MKDVKSRSPERGEELRQITKGNGVLFSIRGSRKCNVGVRRISAPEFLRSHIQTELSWCYSSFGEEEEPQKERREVPQQKYESVRKEYHSFADGVKDKSVDTRYDISSSFPLSKKGTWTVVSEEVRESSLNPVNG